MSLMYYIYSLKVKVAQSCPTLCKPMDCSPWSSQGQNTDVGSLSLLQGIFPSQWSNPGLLHCRWILYQLNHKGSPRILEWVAYPFSSGFPRDRTGSPALQADLLPSGKECAYSAGDCVQSLGWEDPLEKGNTTHSSILAWRIPWTV